MVEKPSKSKDGKLEFTRETVLALSNGTHERGRHSDKQIAELFGISFLDAQKSRKFTSFWETKTEQVSEGKTAVKPKK